MTSTEQGETTTTTTTTTTKNKIETEFQLLEALQGELNGLYLYLDKYKEDLLDQLSTVVRTRVQELTDMAELSRARREAAAAKGEDAAADIGHQED